MSDDLTRLTDEEKAKLTHAMNAGSLGPAIESILAAHTAALLDRAERAERERDELRRRIEIARANLERRHSERDEARSELAALRAAVTGLADELNKQAASADLDRQVPGTESDYWHGRRDGFMESAADVRDLLTDEGDNQ